MKQKDRKNDKTLRLIIILLLTEVYWNWSERHMSGTQLLKRSIKENKPLHPDMP